MVSLSGPDAYSSFGGRSCHIGPIYGSFASIWGCRNAHLLILQWPAALLPERGFLASKSQSAQTKRAEPYRPNLSIYDLPAIDTPSRAFSALL
jgi:hypothetical protein